MKLVEVYCKKCDKLFHRPTRRFNEAIKFSWNQYCSKECEFLFKVKKQSFNCENCGKEVMRTPSAILPHVYCSTRCAIIINNHKYPKRIAKFRVCLICEKEYRFNKKYCSRICRTEAERYTPEELLQSIRDCVKKFGIIPGKRNFSWDIISASVKEFGSWNKAIAKAGFIPNRSHDDRMYKRIISKAKDGHVCDSVSEVLIDNWLFANNIPHEKDVNYPNTNHKADWQIKIKNKIIFVEYFGLANDSPRYDRSIREKEKICQEQGISLIEIMPTSLYPRVNMDKNLREKFESLLKL